MKLRVLTTVLAAAVAALVHAEDTRPAVMREVGFDQRLAQPLPLDATFRDEAGRTVKLGDYFGQRPVVLSLAYYECPMLCTLTLNGLASALDMLQFDPGKEFEIVTISFEPKETRRWRRPRSAPTCSATSGPARRRGGTSSPATPTRSSASPARSASAMPGTPGPRNTRTPPASWSRRRRGRSHATSTGSSTRPRT
jgi:hypothetical protein